MSSLGSIREFVRQQSGVAPSDEHFTDTVDLLDYGYLDSFGIVGLIEMVSQKFAVDLQNFDFYEPGHRTIAGIAAATDRLVAAKSA
jgi:acyl carrier protein